MERDKLIKYISDKLIHNAGKSTAHISIPVLEAILTSLTAPVDGKWISVKDRLPEPLEDVLACNRKGVFCMTFQYSTIRFWIPYGEPNGRTDITHWMPLPELPLLTPKTPDAG